MRSSLAITVIGSILDRGSKYIGALEDAGTHYAKVVIENANKMAEAARYGSYAIVGVGVGATIYDDYRAHTSIGTMAGNVIGGTAFGTAGMAAGTALCGGEFDVVGVVCGVVIGSKASQVGSQYGGESFNWIETKLKSLF